MKHNMKFFLLLPVIAVLFSSCYNDKADQLYGVTTPTTCDTTNTTYAAVINPTVTQYCAKSGCHDASTKANGYDMSSYTGLSLAAQSGRLVGAILHQSGYQAMPNDGATLSDCQKNQIVIWVNKGARNN